MLGPIRANEPMILGRMGRPNVEIDPVLLHIALRVADLNTSGSKHIGNQDPPGEVFVAFVVRKLMLQMRHPRLDKKPDGPLAL